MDKFVAVIESYSSEGNLQEFYKAVQSAQEVLKEDLADFEIEWVLQSILADPVNLVSVLVEHRSQDAWSRAMSDALDFVSSIITLHSKHLESYIKEIIKMCVQEFQPYVRKHAMKCLAALAACEHSAHLESYVPALCNLLRRADEPLSLRVPLAQLLGTMCEFCPELMRDSVVELWRMYLHILDASRIADSLVKGVVEGVTGLLKSFGRELPTLELNMLYDKLTSKYIQIESCEEAALQFLEAHASLYPEKLNGAAELRRRLWVVLESGKRTSADAALLAVYTALASANAALDDLVRQELYPKALVSSKLKNVAFKIISTYMRLYRNKISDDLAVNFEKQIVQLTMRLEFDLERKLTGAAEGGRGEGFDYELMELMGQASWCVTQDVGGAESLLRYLLLLYPHCPPSSRRRLVLHPLLTAADRLRASAVAFLLSESSNDDIRSFTRNGYIKIWLDVFDSQNGKDAFVLRYSRLIFNEFLNSLTVALTAVVEKRRGHDTKLTREKLSALLGTAHQVLSLEHVEEWLADSAPELLGLALRVRNENCLTDALILFVAMLAEKCEVLSLFDEGTIDTEICHDLKSFFADLRLERCSEEARLCASCTALLQAPLCMLPSSGDLLVALKVIFSRNEAEPKLLCKALQKLEKLLNKKKEDEEYEHETVAVCEVIKQLKKVRDSNQWTGKEARLFHRSILRFLGKYETICDEDSCMSTDVFRAKTKMVLKLPNKKEGITYEMNVQELCAAALAHEHASGLRTMLLLLCANYDELKESGAATSAAEMAVALVHALCRCHGRGVDCGPLPHLQHALHAVPDKVACVHRLMHHISGETSPGVRKMLADLLESLLCAEPSSEDTRAALLAALDKCNVMMATQHPVTRRAGLDLCASVVLGLKENMKLFKENMDLFKELMMSVLRTNESDFEKSYDVVLEGFRETLVLCSDDILHELMRQIVDNVMNIDYSTPIYETIVKKSLDTVKIIYDYRRLQFKEIIVTLFCTESLEKQYENEEFPFQWLHILMVLKIYDLDASTQRTIVAYEDFLILKCCMKLKARKNNVDAFTLVFRVLSAYGDVLLELRHQETVDLLSKMIENSTPKLLNKIHSRLEDCFDIYEKLWGSERPRPISSSFEEWFRNMPMKLLTENLRNKIFDSKHMHTIAAMRKMLNFVKTSLSYPEGYVDEIKSWPKMVLRIYAVNATSTRNFKMSYLIDIIAVALPFLNDDEIFDVLHSGLDLNHAPESRSKFFNDFMSAFAIPLLRRGVLEKDGMKPNLTLAISCLVKYHINIKCDDRTYEDIVKTVNGHWTVIQNSSVFEICTLLENLKMLYEDRWLELESHAGRWLLDALADADTNDAIHLLRALSCFSINDVDGELDTLLSTALRLYAMKLPERVSEFGQRSNPRALTALLEALARTANCKMLDIVMKLAASEEESGWWDAAFEACAIALAARCSSALTEHLYRACLKSELAAPVLLRKLLLPLLRNSGNEFCEKFFSDIVADLLACLRRAPRIPPSAQFALMRTLAEYTTTFMLAQLMFEKVSTYALESPHSVLYSKLKVEHTWYLVREVCKCCDQLRLKITLPDNANDQLKKIYRDFQCSNYNCMSAAFCKRRPEPRLYERLLRADVWPLVVDCDRRYKIHIQAHGRASNKNLRVCAGGGGSAGCGSDARTARTTPMRLFTRTLSDDPLRYDFLVDSTSMPEADSGEAVSVCDNELNGHECAAALSALLRQLAGVEPGSWLQQLSDALVASGVHANVKWFLTQMICNCAEELKGSREALTPALLAVVAHTPYVQRNKSCLNGLHVNALNTILKWAKIDVDEFHDLIEEKCLQCILSDIVGLMIDTCVQNRSLKLVHKTLTNLFNDVLAVVGKYVHVDWTKFEDYLKDADLTIHDVCLQLLVTIAKNKVYVPELLVAVTSKLENIHTSRINSTAELFGLAISSCTDRDVREDCLKKFWSLLKRMQHKDKHEYIKMLFYAQAGCGDCCDSDNSRIVVDLAPKMMRTQKEKCYQIIAGYLESADLKECTEVFDIMEIDDALAGEHAYVALNVAAKGLLRMRDELRRRVVQLAAACCDSPLPKVRRNAYLVLLKALQGIAQEESTEPAPKRRKRNYVSEIIKAYQRADNYQITVLRQLGRGLTDSNAEIRQLVADGLRAALSRYDIGLRFFECFVIVVLLTAQCNAGDGISSGSGSGSGGGDRVAARGPNRQEAARRMTVLIQLLFHELNDDFIATKLRDRPLQVRESASRCRLSAQGRTYQGTLRTGLGLGIAARSRPTSAQADVAFAPVLDVQTPISDVINVFVEFALNNIDAAAALYLEIFKCLLQENEASFKTHISSFLYALLKDMPQYNRLQELTPVVLQMCRLCVDDLSRNDGFSIDLVSQLKEYHRGTEGQHLTRLLHEEVFLSAPDDTTFTFSEYIAEDFELDDGRGQFSLQELMNAFGKLSQWDELTLSQQRRRAATLPVLWTDHTTFVHALENHTGPDGWLWRMRCAWKHERADEHFKWLRELDRWPRRPFTAAAVVEAMELHEERQSCSWREWRGSLAPADCLAEWAARLMARRVIVSTLLEESESENEEYGEAARAQRRHERAWAALANRRGLWPQVLQCIQRNTTELYENEALEWSVEHLTAYRSKALCVASERMERTLTQIREKAEDALRIWGAEASPRTRLAAARLLLDLHHDLASASSADITTNLEKMDAVLKSVKDAFDSSTASEKRVTADSALQCADRFWQCANDADSRKEAWGALVMCADDVIKYDPSSGDTALVLLLDKVVDREPDSDAVHMAECVLDLINRSACELDDVIWRALEVVKSKLPDAFCRFPDLIERSSNETCEFYKRCLKLVRCTENSVVQYCLELRDRLERNDAEGWNNTMEEMHRALLEAAEGGLRYELLRARIAARLNTIRCFERTDAFKRTAREVLSRLVSEANQRAPAPTLDLDEVCPALARYPRDAHAAHARSLEHALHIHKGLHIVKIEKQVELISSKQRPALLSLVLSDGRARRFLLKTGDARADAAAQRLQRRLNRLAPYHAATYQVIALDGDFGVIEFVEGCSTLRALIASELDLDGIEQSVPRPRDTELVATAPDARLASYRALCRKVPPFALRRAVERDCGSVQEFVRKQRHYVDSLAAMTVAHWILGLGDRHLDNVLYVHGSGRALAVDWESVLERALELPVPELPPARLTPQLLALAGDLDLLRCRVECVLGAVRAAHAALAAHARLAFLWHPEYYTDIFQDKLSRVHKKMSGGLSSWESTREALERASGSAPARRSYIQLLDAARAPAQTAQATDSSIEHQAAELLRQCTCAALLSATRARWEPWL